MASPFTQKASNEEMKDFEMPKPGLHPATLIAVVDLGTHNNSFQGKTEEQQKIFVAWELATEFDSSGKPFVVGEGYTASLHKKANWRIMLEGWSGRKFADNEEFDPLVLLDKQCNVSLSHGMTSNKKKFTSVESVAQLLAGQTVPKTVNPCFAFHISTWGDAKLDPPIPEWMPRFLGDTVIDVIKKAKEWVALASRQPAAPATHPANGASIQSRHEPVAVTAATMAAMQASAPPF